MESRIKFCVAVAVFIIVTEFASCHFVFKVQHKFAGKGKKLAHFKSHDTRRHSRILASVDLPLGGDSRVDSVGFCSFSLSFVPVSNSNDLSLKCLTEKMLFLMNVNLSIRKQMIPKIYNYYDLNAKLHVSFVPFSSVGHS